MIKLTVISDDALFMGLISQLLNENIELDYIHLSANLSTSDYVLKSKPQIVIIYIIDSLLKQDNTVIKFIKEVSRKTVVYRILNVSNNNYTNSNYIDNFSVERPSKLNTFNGLPFTSEGLYFSNLINYGLSKRETQVFELITKGCTYKEIADNLRISVDTIRTHVKNIYSKLNVSSKSQAVIKVFGSFTS